MGKALRQPRILALVFGSAALAALLILSITISLTPGRAFARDGSPVTAIEVRAILIRAGLDPEALAAAGITQEVATEAATAAAAVAVSSINTLRAADEAFSAADIEHNRLLRLVHTHRASPEESEALPAALSALTSATTARTNAVNTVKDAGLEEIAAPQQAILAAINANRAKGGSLAMAVTNRTDAQWLNLRNALANERISSQNSTQPNTEMQLFLEDVRDENPVIAAQAALNTNLTNINNHWNSAINTAVGG